MQEVEVVVEGQDAIFFNRNVFDFTLTTRGGVAVMKQRNSRRRM